MASRALAAVARRPEDYVRVYNRIPGQVRERVIIRGWGRCSTGAGGLLGAGDHGEALEVCLDVIASRGAR